MKRWQPTRPQALSPRHHRNLAGLRKRRRPAHRSWTAPKRRSPRPRLLAVHHLCARYSSSILPDIEADAAGRPVPPAAPESDGQSEAEPDDASSDASGPAQTPEAASEGRPFMSLATPIALPDLAGERRPRPQRCAPSPRLTIRLRKTVKQRVKAARELSPSSKPAAVPAAMMARPAQRGPIRVKVNQAMMRRKRITMTAARMMAAADRSQ